MKISDEGWRPPAAIRDIVLGEQAGQLAKHSLRLNGHPTSVSLEEAFWHLLQDLARHQNRRLIDLVAEVDGSRQGNLSSALRIYALQHMLRNSASE